MKADIGTDLHHLEQNSIILDENITSLHGKKKKSAGYGIY